MLRSFVVASAVLLWVFSPPAWAQVSLQYKFVEGAKSKSVTVVKANQVLTIAGTNQETGSEQEVVTSVSIGERRADGTLPLTEKVEGLKCQVSAQGMNLISYDSATPPAKKDDSPLAFVYDVFKALVGSTYVVSLNKENKFAGIEGLQQTIDNAQNLDPMAAETLKSRLDAARLQAEFEQRHSNLPDILVRPGESWDRKEVMDIAGGQTLTFQKHYEYQGSVEKDGKTLDKILVKATSVLYALDPTANAMVKVDKSDLHIDSSEGTILFDRAAGSAVETQGKERIKGTLTISINGKEYPSELDLTLEAQTSTNAL
jgi:hypothetical protein